MDFTSNENSDRGEGESQGKSTREVNKSNKSIYVFGIVKKSYHIYEYLVLSLLLLLLFFILVFLLIIIIVHSNTTAISIIYVSFYSYFWFWSNFGVAWGFFWAKPCYFWGLGYIQKLFWSLLIYTYKSHIYCIHKTSPSKLFENILRTNRRTKSSL